MDGAYSITVDDESFDIHDYEEGTPMMVLMIILTMILMMTVMMILMMILMMRLMMVGAGTFDP